MATRKDQSEEKDLFRQATEGTRPLQQDKLAPHRPKRKPVPQQRIRDQEAVVASLLSDDFLPDVETGEELLFVRPGLQQRVLRKFRRGQYAIEGELDLHGRTATEARELLAAFLREACSRGKRCVRIIHGKGLGSAGKLPVLKVKVNTWLRQKNEVLAYCSARPQDGGTGAVYVLLKRG